MKVGVEVVEASDLMPKDGQGSSSPFVEVELDGQRCRTVTKSKDLNPQWFETFFFDVPDPSSLPDLSLLVIVYHDSKASPATTHGHHRHFLGRLRLSGSSISPSFSDSMVQRFPLEKRGLFSHIRGELALRLYAAPDSSSSSSAAAPAAAPPPAQESAPNAVPEPQMRSPRKPKPEKEPPKPAEPSRFFYSVGAEPTKPPPAAAEVHVDKAWAGPPPPGATILRAMPAPGPPKPEFGLTPTSPPIAGRLGYWGRDKISSTYDLVEQMHFLYVNVVKARDLPVMDVTGSLDPYAEVKLGNYKGTTRHLEKNQTPVWRQVFAFSKDRIQANVLEVTVKDKDLVKDDFVGRIQFDLTDVPLRVPPDSPLAPQWYRLEDKKGVKLQKGGEIMLAVWMGTQADEAFPDAWHSDAHSVSLDGLAHTRSKVYFSPKLCYLRVHVFEAQDLVPAEKGRTPDCYVKVQLGGQMRRTRPAPPGRGVNPLWGEEMMFIASDPFDEPLVITVEDRVGPGQDVPIGRLSLPVSGITKRTDKPVPEKWFSLAKPRSDEDEPGEKKKESKFSSKLRLRLFLDVGYHVLDESTYYSSDFRPVSRLLHKPSIGILELGILEAKNLTPMKAKDGGGTDAYCVAKYGPKWVRTRTILSSLAPRWHEQYTWEVFDPCTVITIGVFDNCHVSGGKNDVKDQRIGKVRIRLSTLETDRVYTHYHPLLVLQPSGLKKTGELHLAVRFTCTARANMIVLYGKPLLPKMHYTQPIPVLQLDYLRHQAMQIVAARLVRAEPPLRREVVEYMLDVDSHMWSLRRSKANFFRITALFSGLAAIGRWFDSVRNWKNPITTILVHVLFLILVCYPELILSTIFLYLFMIGIWNYRFRPRHPPHMDTKLSHAEWAVPDELEEEFDTFPSTKDGATVRRRYDRLRSVGGRVQAVAGDLATQVERSQAILNWRDPRATAIFIMFALIVAVFLYVTPFQVVAVLVGLYLLRHPKFRTKMPSVPYNFYRRLPAKSDMLL